MTSCGWRTKETRVCKNGFQARHKLSSLDRMAPKALPFQLPHMTRGDLRWGPKSMCHPLHPPQTPAVSKTPVRWAPSLKKKNSGIGKKAAFLLVIHLGNYPSGAQGVHDPFWNETPNLRRDKLGAHAGEEGKVRWGLLGLVTKYPVS